MIKSEPPKVKLVYLL